MAKLIDDLLDVSRINKGKTRVQKKVMPLAEVIQVAVEAAQPLIEECQHSLTVALPSEPIYLHADPGHLVQVFSNLLSNAAKYTNSGGRIWLTAHRQEREVVVTVTDTGIGIPPEMLDSIFEMFAQVEGAPKQSRSGLGIGLWAAKWLIEMQEGTIEAKSRGRGQGSEFIVRLPLHIDIEKPGNGTN